MASETVGLCATGKGINQAGKHVKISIAILVEGDKGTEVTYVENFAPTVVAALKAAATQFDVLRENLTVDEISLAPLHEEFETYAPHAVVLNMSTD